MNQEYLLKLIDWFQTRAIEWERRMRAASTTKRAKLYAKEAAGYRESERKLRAALTVI